MTAQPIYAGLSTALFLPRHLALALSLLLAGLCCASSRAASQPPQPTYADVAYAQTLTEQRLDLYLPTRQPALSPVVIWVHGGAFTVGDKRSIVANNLSSPPRAAIVPADGGPLRVSQIQVPDVAVLTAKGYAVIGLNYRLAPGIHSWEDSTLARRHSVQDAKAAVRFLRANATQYHLDPDKFAAWGNSAGGYIVSMLGATADQAAETFDDPTLGNAGVSSAVQAVVDWFGPINVVTTNTQRAAIGVCAYLPVPRPFPDNLVDQAMQYSPLSYIPRAKVLPPFLIAHGDVDCAVPAAQSQELYAALSKVHATATLTILPGAGHEDPAFMKTQMTPTFAFLDAAFGMPH
jgi:acetyl esterase/lipase